jgi:RecA/RadA recombinase
MNLYSKVKSFVGNDICEIFGDTGSGKTTFSLELMKSAVESGKKVFMVDTERNLKDDLEKDYVYLPSFELIYDFVRSKLPNVDVLILDSIGVPALGQYASLDMRQRGDCLLKCQEIFYRLKKWAYKNNSICMITNQPVSEFGKEKGTILYPWGDKAIFFVKEVWKSNTLSNSPDKTICSIESFRSRKMGRGRRMFKLTITDSGVVVE